MFVATRPVKFPAILAATGEINTRDRRRRTLAVFAVLIVVGGCNRDRRSTALPDDQEDHAGHFIPAHKPKTFPDAVKILKTLDDAIGRQGEGAGRPADDKTLSMAEDIAGWLPEVAAESDMPEGPWGEVNRLSAALVAEYRALREKSGGRGGAAHASGRNVAALATILAKADPRWFDNRHM